MTMIDAIIVTIAIVLTIITTVSILIISCTCHHCVLRTLCSITAKAGTGPDHSLLGSHWPTGSSESLGPGATRRAARLLSACLWRRCRCQDQEQDDDHDASPVFGVPC